MIGATKERSGSQGLGIYVFSAQEFDTETERQLELMRDQGTRYGTPEERTLETLDDIREERAQLRAWAERFSFRIPARWGSPGAGHDIENDVSNPQANAFYGVQIEAAIRYPAFPPVQDALVHARRLTRSQLKILAEVCPDRFDYFAGVQRAEFGVSEETIEVARRVVPQKSP